MSDSSQLIGANAAAAILGIPVKNGKPSGTVYDTLKPLECVSVQLDGRALKTWRRGDVEALREKLAETTRTVIAEPVGRASNFGQWQHRVKELETQFEWIKSHLNNYGILLAHMVKDLESFKITLTKDQDYLHAKINRLLVELGVDPAKCI